MLRNFDLTHIPRQKVYMIGAGLAFILLFVVGYALWQGYQGNRYAKEVEKLNAQIKATELKASEAEGRANQSKQAAEAKDRELDQVQVRAEAADRALDAARNVTVTVRQKYDQTRNAPVSVAPVSLADACAKLADLGYACQ